MAATEIQSDSDDIVDEEGNLNLNWEDELVEGTCITHDGAVKNERIQKVLEAN